MSTYFLRKDSPAAGGETGGVVDSHPQTEPDLVSDSASFVGKKVVYIVRILLLFLMVSTGNIVNPVAAYCCILAFMLAYYLLSSRRHYASSHDLEPENVAMEIGLLPMWRCACYDTLAFVDWVFALFAFLPLTVGFGKRLFGSKHVFVMAWEQCHFSPAWGARTGPVAKVLTSTSMLLARMRSATQLHPRAFAAYGKFLPQMWLELFVCVAWVSGGNTETLAMVVLTKAVMATPGSPLTALALIGSVAVTVSPKIFVSSYNPYGLCIVLASVWGGFDCGFFFGRAESEAVPGRRRSWGFSGVLSRIIQLVSILHLFLFMAHNNWTYSAITESVSSICQSALARVQNVDGGTFPWFDVFTFFSIGYSVGAPMGDYSMYAKTQYESMLFTWQGALAIACLCLVNVVAPFRSIALVPSSEWSLAVVLSGPMLVVGVLFSIRKLVSGSILLRLRASPIADYVNQLADFQRGFVAAHAFTIDTAVPADVLVDEDGNFLPWHDDYTREARLFNYIGKTAVSGVVPGENSFAFAGDGASYDIRSLGNTFAYKEKTDAYRRERVGTREVFRPAAQIAPNLARASQQGDVGGVLSASSLQCGFVSTPDGASHVVAGCLGDVGVASSYPTVIIRSNQPAQVKLLEAPRCLCVWERAHLESPVLSEVVCNALPGDIIATRGDIVDLHGHIDVVYSTGDESDSLVRARVASHNLLPFNDGSGDFHTVNVDLVVPVARGGQVIPGTFREVTMADALSRGPHAWEMVVGHTVADMPYLNASGWNYGAHVEVGALPLTITVPAAFLPPHSRVTSALHNYSAWANSPYGSSFDRIRRVASAPLTPEEIMVIPAGLRRLWVQVCRPTIAYLLTRHNFWEAAVFCISVVVCAVTAVDALLAVSYDMGVELSALFAQDGIGTSPKGLGHAMLFGLRVTPSGAGSTMLSYLGISSPFAICLALGVCTIVLWASRYRPFLAIASTAATFLFATLDMHTVYTLAYVVAMSSVSALICFLAVLRLLLFVVAVLKAANTVGQLSVTRWDRIFDFVARATWVEATTCSTPAAGVFQSSPCQCNGSSIPFTKSVARMVLAFDRRSITFHGRGCHRVLERGGTYYAFDAYGEPVDVHMPSFLNRSACWVEVGSCDDNPAHSRFNIEFNEMNDIPIYQKFSLIASCAFAAFCLFGGFATEQVVFVLTVSLITGSVVGGILAAYLETRAVGGCYPIVFDVSKEQPCPSDVSTLFGAPVSLSSRRGEPDAAPPLDVSTDLTRFFLRVAVSVVFADVFLSSAFGKFEVDAGLGASGLLFSSLLECASTSDTHIAGVSSVVSLLSKLTLPVRNHLGEHMLNAGKAVNAFSHRPTPETFAQAWKKCQDLASFSIALDDPKQNAVVKLGFGAVDFQIPPLQSVRSHKACADDFSLAQTLVDRYANRVPGLDVQVARRGDYASGVQDVALFNPFLRVFTVDTFVTVTGRAMKRPQDELPYLGVCAEERVFNKSLRPDGTTVGFLADHLEELTGGAFSAILLRSAAGFADGSNDVTPEQGANFVATSSNYNLVGSTTPEFGKNAREALDNPRTWVTISKIATKFVTSMVLLLYPYRFFRKFETRVIEKSDALTTTGRFDRIKDDGTVEPCERKRSRIITIVNFAVQIFAMLAGPAVKRLMYAPLRYGYVNVYADGANPNKPQYTLLTSFNTFATRCKSVDAEPYWVSGDIGGWDTKMSHGLLFVSFSCLYATTSAGSFFLNCVFFAFALSTFKCALLGAVLIRFFAQMSSGFWLTSIIDTIGRYIMGVIAFIHNAKQRPYPRASIMACIHTVRHRNLWLKNFDLETLSVAQLIFLYSICTIGPPIEKFADRADGEYTPTITMVNKGDDCVTCYVNKRTDPNYMQEFYPEAYDALCGRRTKRERRRGQWLSTITLLGASAASGALASFGMPIHHSRAGEARIVACSMEFSRGPNGLYHHSTSLEEMFGKLQVMRNTRSRFPDANWLHAMEGVEDPSIPFHIPSVLLEYTIQAHQTVLAKNPTSAVMQYFLHRLVEQCKRAEVGFTVEALSMYTNNMWELPVDLKGLVTFEDAVTASGLVPGSIDDWSELAHYGLTRSSFKTLVDEMLGAYPKTVPDQPSTPTAARVLFHGATGSGKTTQAIRAADNLARQRNSSVIVVVPNQTVGQDVAKAMSKWRLATDLNYLSRLEVAESGVTELHQQGAGFDPGTSTDRCVNIVTVQAFLSRLTKMRPEALAEYVVLFDEIHLASRDFPIQEYQHVLDGAAGLILIAAEPDAMFVNMVDQVIHCKHISTNIRSVTNVDANIANIKESVERLLAPEAVRTYGDAVVVRVVGESFRKMAIQQLLFPEKRKTAVDVLYTVVRGSLSIVRPNHKGNYTTSDASVSSIDLAEHPGKVVAVILDNSVAAGMNIRMPDGTRGTTVFYSCEKQFVYGTEVTDPNGVKRIERSFEKRTNWYKADGETFHQTASRIRGTSDAIRVNFPDIDDRPAASMYPKLPYANPHAFDSVYKYLRGVDMGLFYFFVLTTQFACKSSVAMSPNKVYIMAPFLQLLMEHATNRDMVSKRLHSAARLRGGHTSVPAIFEAFSGAAVRGMYHPLLVVLPRMPLDESVEDASWYAAVQMGRLDAFHQVYLRSARAPTAPGMPTRLSDRVAPCGVSRGEGGRLRTVHPIFSVRPPRSRMTVANIMSTMAQAVMAGSGL